MTINTYFCFSFFFQDYFKITNKKEELGDKLSNRDMIQQIGVNPFLSQSNYIDDVSVRDQFLKPVNTTQGQRI